MLFSCAVVIWRKFIKPRPLSFCLFMLIMLIICSSSADVYLSGSSPNGPAVQTVLTAVSGRSAAGHPDHRCPRCFLLHEKLHPRQIYVNGMAPINAPQLF